MTRKLLDVTRLCLRAHHAAPTGIDRVEHAYTTWLLAQDPAKTAFVVTLPAGLWFQLPRRVAARLAGTVAQRWRHGWSELPVSALYAVLVLTALFAGLCRALRLTRPLAGPAVYVNVSHHLLHAPRALKALCRFHNARFVAMVHDLIPIAHPEYARPGHTARHRRRLATVLALADGIVTNSEATLRDVARHGPQTALLRAAPLGIHAEKTQGGAKGQAYFLCIGTIEPRKNHLLLLHLWRAMAETRAGMPKLLIVGRRGWENEMIVDMLERCEAIHAFVEEKNRVTDGELAALIQGCAALLMPSFAEGFGLPVAEALAAGVPVICSDLAAHREVGGDVPEYLDPLDAAAWRHAIERYAQPESGARAAQLERLRQWRAPNWENHFAIAGDLIDEAARTQPRKRA